MTVVYNFAQRFVPHIVGGIKDQTIRAPRRREPRIGEALRLQHGARLQPKLIGFVPCIFAGTIALSFSRHVALIYDRFVSDNEGYDPIETLKGSSDLDALGRRDGFDGFDDMGTYWFVAEGDAANGGGWLFRTLIRWHAPLCPTAAEAESLHVAA